MIRKAARDDLTEALSWPKNADEFKFWFGDKISFGSSAAKIWAQIKADTRATYAFIDNERLLGFGQCYEKHPKARHIACLIVTPEARGQGFGRQFVNELMDNALTMPDVKRITLNVYPDNLPARQLYRDLKFDEKGETRGMIAMQYQPHNNI